MGVVCPLGNSTESLWDAMINGRSGVVPWDSPMTKALPASYAGLAREFTGDIEDFGTLEKEQKKSIRKGLKVMCRESQMAVAAAQRAIADAGLTAGRFDPERAGCLFGSDYMLTLPEDFSEAIEACRDANGAFDYSRWGGQGKDKVMPLWLLKYLPNMPASHIAIYNDLRGPSNSITMREAAANLALAEAFHIISRGSADIMVAGATGTRVHPMKSVHTMLAEEVADNNVEPAKASRPFDRNRTGMVMGEGAGVVVLEELATAQARGSRIYGEVVGAGSAQVALPNNVARRDVALGHVIRKALAEANIEPNRIGHIHAHGLGTQSCDADEARAIRETFGNGASRIPVAAAKSYFGNLGAGSGAVELIASVLALVNRRLPAILNFETPDPECPITPAGAEHADPGDCFVNLSVTPQGQASALVVRQLA